MSIAVDARAIVAEMEVGFLPPIRISALSQDWATFQRLNTTEGDELSALRAFVGEVVEERMAEVNAMGIVQTLTPVLADLRTRPEMTARDLIASTAEVFATDPLDSGEVRSTAVDAFDRLRTSRDERTTISRALVMCRRADDVLETLEKVAEQFLMDRDTAPKAFKTGADRERFSKLVLVDVSTDRRYLASTLKELVALDEQASHTREELLRALAAMNMFTALGKQDVATGNYQNRAPAGLSVTRPPTHAMMFQAGDVRLRDGVRG